MGDPGATEEGAELETPSCGVSPYRTARLVALRTKAEVDASTTIIRVYIAEIPIKSASRLLQCVQ